MRTDMFMRARECVYNKFILENEKCLYARYELLNDDIDYSRVKIFAHFLR